MYYWLLYLICAGLIFFSGTRLSKHGDIIAEKSGLGRTWIGLILMATVTSLPELATGASSTAFHRLPDIAAGDIFGSCMFNILILALLDVGALPPLSARAHQGHILSASFGILLLGVGILGIALGNQLPALGWIGPYTIVILIVYFLAVRMIFTHEKRRIAQFVEQVTAEAQYGKVTLRSSMIQYAINSVIVVASAMFLPIIGENIAAQSGLGQTFVGSIFIALSTSLPELVVTGAALKIGAVDMAFGNLFGSNLFNMAILAIDDILYTPGPILSAVSPDHLVSAIAAIAMTSIAIAGLTYRHGKKTLFFSWDSIGILLFYFFAIAVLFRLRN
jgi:cation:H+ antiporter